MLLPGALCVANSKQVWAFLDWHVFQCYPIFVKKTSKVPLGVSETWSELHYTFWFAPSTNTLT